MNVIFLFCYKMKKAIVLGGSRGIGKAIADSLKTIDCDEIATSRKELDTSNLDSVKKFAQDKETDILVLNTGGPPVFNTRMSVSLS